MARDSQEIPFGKCLAWSPLPIPSGNQEDDPSLRGRTEPQRDLEAKTMDEEEDGRGGKKKDSRTPEPVDQQRQTSGPQRVKVVDVGSGSSSQDRESQRSGHSVGPRPSDRSTGGSTIQDTVAINAVGTVRTPKRTLALAGRVGKHRWPILIDLGSTGNYVSAQVCTACWLNCAVFVQIITLKTTFCTELFFLLC